MTFREFMRYYGWIILTAAAVPVVLVLMLGVRGQRGPGRPFHFFYDMKYQPKYVPQGQSAFFENGMAQRYPVQGTVPFAGGDYFADAGSYEENPDLARTDEAFYFGRTGYKPGEKGPDGAPVPVWAEFAPESALARFFESGEDPKSAAAIKTATQRMIDRGRERFAINCRMCHGSAGDGNGIIKRYIDDNKDNPSYGGAAPASYHQERLRNPTPSVPDNWQDGYLYNVITNGKGNMMGYAHQIKPEDRWALVAYVRVLQRAWIGTSAEAGPQAEAAK